MTLGDKVKNLREQKNMTQMQLAERLGVTQAYINAIESGIRIPGFLLGVTLAKVLGTTAEQLIAK